MTSDSIHPVDLDRLTREEPFVRALARALAAEAADDVVQQTYVRALAHRGGTVHAPRPWLARIARNVARNLRRGEQRRRSAEPHAASRDGTPTAAEIVEREERRVAVVRAIEKLAPQLRTVLLLRYFEGLSPQRIARELELPVTTVWNRLRRALALLRADLEREHGDRRAWLAPLLPAFAARTTPTSSLTAMTAGAILMTTTTKILSLTGVLFTAIVALIWTMSGSAPEPAPRSAGDPLQPPLAKGTIERPADPGTTPRNEVIAPSVETADATTGTLTVRAVYGEDERPFADLGLRLECSGMADRRYGMLPARTDAQGVATFATLPAGRCRVWTNRDRLGDPTFYDATIVAGENTELVARVPQGIDVNGLVVDHDGTPVAGADIYLAPLAMIGRDAEIAARSGDDGRFTLLGCSRICLIGARALGHGHAPIRAVHASVGAAIDLRLELGETGGAVSGTVVFEDGSPAADAFVRVGRGKIEGLVGRADGLAFPAQVRCDAQGRFVALSVEPGEQPVAVRAAGRATWKGTCRVDDRQTTTLAITLPRGASCSGTITDKDGNPVHRAEVSAGERGTLAYFEAYTRKDGTFHIAGLPAGPLRLSAVHETLGRATGNLHADPGGTLQWDARLSMGLVLHGRILTKAGEPVSEASVYASTERGAGQWSGSADCDAAGRFALANCPGDKKLTLHVDGLGVREKTIEGVDPNAGEVEVRVTVLPPPSATITGRLLYPDGTVPVRATISAHSKVDSGSGNRECDKDTGAFRLEKLRPGEYRVRADVDGYPSIVTAWRTLGEKETWDVGTLQFVTGGDVSVSWPGDTPAGLRYAIFDTDAHFVAWSQMKASPVRSRLLRPGRYRMSITAPRIAPQVVPFEIRTADTTSLAIQLREGQPREIQVTIPFDDDTVREVRILVQDAAGQRVLDHTRSIRNEPLTLKTGFAIGRYTLSATCDGRSGTTEFEVNRGDAATTIELAVQ